MTAKEIVLEYIPTARAEHDDGGYFILYDHQLSFDTHRWVGATLGYAKTEELAWDDAKMIMDGNSHLRQLVN